MDQICISDEAMARMKAIKSISEPLDMSSMFKVGAFISDESLPDRNVEVGDVVLMIYANRELAVKGEEAFMEPVQVV